MADWIHMDPLLLKAFAVSKVIGIVFVFWLIIFILDLVRVEIGKIG